MTETQARERLAQLEGHLQGRGLSADEWQEAAYLWWQLGDQNRSQACQAQATARRQAQDTLGMAPATGPNPGSGKSVLLVVLLVVGLMGAFGVLMLSAILFPVFAKAREKARTASCQSNQKQIALAMIQYCQDYDEMLPPHHNAKVNWAQMCEPYLKNVEVLRCPSDLGSGCSYLYRNVPVKGLSVQGVDQPMALVMGVDGDGKGLAKRHNDGFNAWFCDGHVKWLPGADLGSSVRGLDQLGPPVGLPTIDLPHAP
jgi:prepilin-type processing-associated H-X9-DG protein